MVFPITEISCEDLLGAAAFIVITKGVPWIVAFAMVTVVLTAITFSSPPIAAMYLLITVSAVIPSGIGKVIAGFSVGFPSVSK